MHGSHDSHERLEEEKEEEEEGEVRNFLKENWDPVLAKHRSIQAILACLPRSKYPIRHGAPGIIGRQSEKVKDIRSNEKVDLFYSLVEARESE